jgi:hypothetical protein
MRAIVPHPPSPETPVPHAKSACTNGPRVRDVRYNPARQPHRASLLPAQSEVVL